MCSCVESIEGFSKAVAVNVIVNKFDKLDEERSSSERDAVGKQIHEKLLHLASTLEVTNLTMEDGGVLEKGKRCFVFARCLSPWGASFI